MNTLVIQIGKHELFKKKEAIYLWTYHKSQRNYKKKVFLVCFWGHTWRRSGITCRMFREPMQYQGSNVSLLHIKPTEHYTFKRNWNFQLCSACASICTSATAYWRDSLSILRFKFQCTSGDLYLTIHLLLDDHWVTSGSARGYSWLSAQKSLLAWRTDNTQGIEPWSVLSQLCTRQKPYYWAISPAPHVILFLRLIPISVV